MIIGFHGRAGAGKDTAAAALIRDGWQRAFFSEPLKAGLNAMFGWTPEMWDDRDWKETPIAPTWLSPRELAISLGTQWGRDTIDRNLWVSLTMRRLPPGRDVVFTDVRFINEANAIEAAGGIIIEIVRPNNPTPSVNHSSEERLPSTLIDHQLINDGYPATLQRQVRDLVSLY
jgi:hypothetical protein